MEALFEEANVVYRVYSKHCDLNKLTKNQLKKLVQYIVKKEDKYKAEYSGSKTRLMKRLMEFKPQWENYFRPVEQEEITILGVYFVVIKVTYIPVGNYKTVLFRYKVTM